MKSIKQNNILIILLGSILCVSLVCISGSSDKLAMSDAEMANMIGGQCADCGYCETVNETFTECYHTTFPPNCSEWLYGCIWNVVNTASCWANQGPGAPGCDTQFVYPYTAGWWQFLYAQSGYSCSASRNDVHLWLELYWGCDTSPTHWCNPNYIFMTCDTGDCPGDIILDSPRQYKFKCGC